MSSSDSDSWPDLSVATADDHHDDADGPDAIWSTSTSSSTSWPPTVVASLNNCSFPTAASLSWQQGQVEAGCVCAVYFLFGLLCTFFGYRCFKAIMFLTGFVFASLLVYLICLEEQVLPVWTNALIALLAGLLFGLITLLVQYVGLFMLGFHGGLLLGIVALSVAYPWVQPHNAWISVGILLVAGLTMALTNLYFQKSLTIFCSAFYGSAVMATGLDFFLEKSAMLMWIWDRVRVKPSQPPCWYSWLILASWPVALFLGTITQIVVSGRNIYHEQHFPARKPRPKAESREERKQRKYRYLYQVRTCHGDVVSRPLSHKYVHQLHQPLQA